MGEFLRDPEIMWAGRQGMLQQMLCSRARDETEGLALEEKMEGKAFV